MLCQNGTNKIRKSSKWDPVWGEVLLNTGFLPEQQKGSGWKPFSSCS